MTKYSYFFTKISLLIALVERFCLIYILYMFLSSFFFTRPGHRESPDGKTPPAKHCLFVFIFYVMIALLITILNQFRQWKNMLPIKSYEKNSVLVSADNKNTGFWIFDQTFDRNDIFSPKFTHISKIQRWFRIYIDSRWYFSLKIFGVKNIDFFNSLTGQPFLDPV